MWKAIVLVVKCVGVLVWEATVLNALMVALVVETMTVWVLVWEANKVPITFVAKGMWVGVLV